MRKIKVSPLSLKGFQKFGTFCDVLHPDSPHFGSDKDPICFFRDMIQIRTGNHVSISSAVCLPVEKTIKIMEYHSKTPEASMMLDGDVIMAFGPATADHAVPIDEIEAFFIPQGVMVCIHPGVWHYAQIPAGNQKVTAMVLLPERAYANDCYTARLMEEQQIEIV